ncbi:MAG: hypothetical protein A2Y24_02520 [Clostridiales bacterium GWE2_32_10]|nr:MAG: hypothetical protein A2Y24_02520 [Clostridiales bacterium GWE2_32_10]
MKNNKSIKCSVDECIYNDVDNAYCTLDDINVTYDDDMELDAVCASFEPSDDVDDDTDDDIDDESNPDDLEK